MRRIITHSAQLDIDEITEFIFQGNRVKAYQYRQNAIDTFFDMPEDFLPVRADNAIPDYVRKIRVKGKGFESYFLYIAFLEDAIGLVAAFRPGLPHERKWQRTETGIRELRDR